MICVRNGNLTGIHRKLLLKKNVHSYKLIKADHFIIIIIIIVDSFWLEQLVI